ncbi:MAG: ABC transporter ATP-binding protein [Flavobacteriales bacterium]
MDTELLSVKNLTVSFLKDGLWKPVVKNISFSVNLGEILGIVGESGSGKSVSCLALLGLLPKEAARIESGVATLRIQNQVIELLKSSEASHSLRGCEIGMIFQEPMTSLNPLFKCGDQLVEVIRRHLNLAKKEAVQLAEEWFQKVELPNPSRIISSYPHELSGGQRQRVMIAMAMCCKPKLLIADEPTTALDVTVQKSVLDLISRLQIEHHTAVVFISHDLGVVKCIADNVLVMQQGVAREYDSADKIFNNPSTSYTKGLIACKPENTNKKYRLTTVDQVIDGDALSLLRPPTNKNDGQVIYRVEGLKKSYGKRASIFGGKSEIIKAVNNVSFEIRKGETLGLVGESGCGKSTLSKIITGLLIADAGVLIYNGVDISGYSMKDWRQLRGRIQFIFQDPFSALNPKHSVKKVLEEVLVKHQVSLNKQERESLCAKLINDVGLSVDSLYKYPHQFSGGQRQRVVIARALAANPEFIIADESVSALDVSVQAQVLNLLNDLKAEYNLTFLFISHDLSVVNYMSDRVMVMREGEIVEYGTAEEIYTNPRHSYTQKLLDSVY